MRAPIGLVVPMYNEEERLADYGKPLLDFIGDQPAGSELVFVDDGSVDGSVAAVEELIGGTSGAPARVLRRPHRGKGAAVAVGLAELTTPYGGFCDLDLSTPLEQFERVMDTAMRAPVLAIGSRDLPASRLVQPESPVREALGRAYNKLLQVTLTPGVVDTQCGAKVAARAVWDVVLPRLHEDGYAWDAELVAVAQALGIEVLEVPVEWRHDSRSRLNVGRDGMAMVLATPRIWRRARIARAEQLHAPPIIAVSASDADTSNEVFDDVNAAQLAAVDRSHWWFRSKAALVSTALRRTLSHRDGWLVDAGGGAGGVTAMLGWNPDRTLVVEGSATLALEARRRHGFDTARGSVDHLPMAGGCAEVVCLLDVIEHLADPIATLREASRVLAPDGVVVINVPAHQWLWSASDEVLGHHRRYEPSVLRSQLAAAGLAPVLMTHVFSWLVPPVWAKRRLASGGQAELGLDQTSAVIDRTAMVLTRLERAVVGRASLPLGTSVLCVARRLPG
ncbi:MAG TPA: glycosyltransferase [Acidimicrobiales bacterium]